MYLIHEATPKHPDGVIDVHVQIVNKNKRKGYVYSLSSEWAVRRFHFYYRKGRRFHGLALAILNKFKLKGEKENARIC